MATIRIDTSPSSASGRSDEQGWRTGAIDFGDIQAEDERATRFFAPIVARARQHTPPRSFRSRLLYSMFGPRSDQFWTAVLLIGIAACMVGLVWPNLKHLGEGMVTHSLIGWEGKR